ncbi:siderophore-interacting protein [Skermania piniformis]|uniref:Siderophore-interacting protein n=1 Tax=Skermania pinensis TaxID=39122 RepID=A0ABX8S7T1_9ACTN|nr:siderophore-interacting protein [Skermania piniformis]QXQ13813.1 siderophore-interacting protein [Skermania piniformis]
MATLLTVTGTQPITPTLRRLWFTSADLSAFADSAFTDRYVKLMFPRPGVPLPGADDPRSIDLRTLRATLPPADMPTLRTYTALFPNVEAGTMAIDFVVHGDAGVAGPWAHAAEVGDSVLVNGPGGAYAPDPTAAWHLLAGDESAIPAISAAAAALPEDAVGALLVLVDSVDHEPVLTTPAGVVVQFLHRDGTDGQLAAAVRDLDWPDGRIQAFVHGEAHEVMHEIRPYLFRERKLARRQVSISGYWRRGRTEEGFRAWKAELAAAEGATG